MSREDVCEKSDPSDSGVFAAWVQGIHDKIENLKREHDDLRKELSAHSLLSQIRSEMRELKTHNETFHDALQTFRALEEQRTEQILGPWREEINQRLSELESWRRSDQGCPGNDIDIPSESRLSTDPNYVHMLEQQIKTNEYNLRHAADTERALLAQIQRMSRSIAIMQEQMVKVERERDSALRERNILQGPTL